MSQPLEPLAPRNPQRGFVALALAIALAALAFSVWQSLRPPIGSSAAPHITQWQHAKQTGVLRVGYGGFPPYTIINPNEPDPSKRVTGFCVDLVNAIAARLVPPMKVEWQQFSWDTMKADLATDRFDFIGD